MKKLFFIVFLCLMNSCDDAGPVLEVYNYSDEAVYFSYVFGKVDSLPQKPYLRLFYNDNTNMTDALGNKIFGPVSQGEYRIDAYDVGGIRFYIINDDLAFPEGVNEMTMFFITEKTMREYSWEEIYEKQLYESRVVITESELKNNC